MGHRVQRISVLDNKNLSDCLSTNTIELKESCK